MSNMSCCLPAVLSMLSLRDGRFGSVECQVNKLFHEVVLDAALLTLELLAAGEC